MFSLNWLRQFFLTPGLSQTLNKTSGTTKHFGLYCDKLTIIGSDILCIYQAVEIMWTRP